MAKYQHSDANPGQSADEEGDGGSEYSADGGLQEDHGHQLRALVEDR